MPNSARTLDSGYSNEDETRPPTTSSLPMDRDPNSPMDPQNLQNPRRTPMVEEADEEAAAADEHHDPEDSEEVSAAHIQTFYPDSGASSLENGTEYSSRAKAFRAMAEDMHEKRMQIQNVSGIFLIKKLKKNFFQDIFF